MKPFYFLNCLTLSVTRLIALSMCCFAALNTLIAQESTPPNIDVDAIVVDHLNFLINREPEMTDAEYALYQKVVPLVLKRPDFALTLLETMLQDEEPESPAFSYVLANIYYAQNNYDLAEVYYRRAIDDFPNFLRAWINLGILYYRQDKFEQAIPCFTKSIELGNMEAQIRGLLGYSLLKEDRPIAAEATFLDALAIDPQNTDWIEALVSLYLETEQYERAEPMIRTLIKKQPNRMLHRRLLVSLMISQQQEVEAITELEISHAMHISEPQDLLQLAGLYAKNTLFEEAYAVFETLVPEHTDLIENQLFSYAETLLVAKEYSRAQQLLAIVDSNLSTEAQIRSLHLLARIELATDQQNQALETLRSLFKMDPLYGPALMTAADIYKQQGKLTHATQYFSQAKSIEAHAYVASIELANIALSKAEYKEALKHLEDALRVESTPELQSFRASIMAILSTRSGK